ncbi:hypothetical protein Q8F55_003888 [Vanrija albida]|uniref:Ecp2 effector protein domain-containing protein n=1 Tax=Vanrija albida TaxID=181172 RepID=A0ABR3Q577_9TREE
MLAKTVILALLASLAAAAPAVEVDNSAAVPQENPSQLSQNTEVPEGFVPDWETSGLSARDSAGLRVICFDQTGCQGNIISHSVDTYINQGTTWAMTFGIHAYQRMSCRFDTWNDWRGEFYLALGNFPSEHGSSRRISGSNYSHGSGQYCVDMWTNIGGGRARIDVSPMAVRW